MIYNGFKLKVQPGNGITTVLHQDGRPLFDSPAPNPKTAKVWIDRHLTTQLRLIQDYAAIMSRSVRLPY